MVTIVIFGASGDISHKKVIPGLYEWYNENNKAITNIIGFGRTKLTSDEFKKTIDSKQTNNNDKKEETAVAEKKSLDQDTNEISQGNVKETK